MATTSPWRASSGVFVLFLVAGAGFGAVLWLGAGEPIAGLAVGVVTVLLIYPAELQAAFRLSWALREFAGQVPGEPVAEESRMGDQSLRWADLGLSVEGGTHRFRVTGLVAEAQAEGRTWDVRVSRPREGARRVLEDLDCEPAFDGVDERLPSVYPRLSAAKVGALVTFLGLVGVGLGGPVLAGGVYPLWWLWVGPVAGLLAAGLRWAGLAGVRRALVALVEGLHESGVEFDRIDRLEGLLRLQFALRTPRGTATVTAFALPGGRLVVGQGDREREVRFGDARAVGRDLATWLTDTPDAAGEEAIDEPGPGDLTAGQRLVFAVLGAGFAAYGGVLLVGVTGSGPVAVDTVAFGLLSGVLGLGCLALAVHGRVPAV